MLLKLPEKASKSSDMKALVPKTAVAEDTAERPSFAHHENPTPSAPPHSPITQPVAISAFALRRGL